MKQTLLYTTMLFCLSANAQLLDETEPISIPHTVLPFEIKTVPVESPVIFQPPKWKLTSNRVITGGLVFVAGASKGFNETLQFHWSYFRKKFPNANPYWFNPAVSWKNKYKNRNRLEGEKFPLSTSLFVAFTDQYHLNTFINRVAWTTAFVIKIGEGKRPWKHYLFDALYYTACHQAGFALTYYPFCPGGK